MPSEGWLVGRYSICMLWDPHLPPPWTTSDMGNESTIHFLCQLDVDVIKHSWAFFTLKITGILVVSGGGTSLQFILLKISLLFPCNAWVYGCVCDISSVFSFYTLVLYFIIYYCFLNISLNKRLSLSTFLSLSLSLSLSLPLSLYLFFNDNSFFSHFV